MASKQVSVNLKCVPEEDATEDQMAEKITQRWKFSSKNHLPNHLLIVEVEATKTNGEHSLDKTLRLADSFSFFFSYIGRFSKFSIKFNH